MRIRALILVTVLALSSAFAAGTPTGLEGEYIDTDMDGSVLSVTADHWHIKIGDIDVDNTYTAKKTGDNTYAVTITPVDPALKTFVSTSVVRKEGDMLFVKNEGVTTESKYKKK
ncbi:MAG: hypothetical protein QOH88_1432 [Verrucomicrobiota bacterium]|jgi:hypothetical protein